ncbi:ABC transporter substrate-binding protein [Streptomyces sp. JNUCC 64]
MTTVLHRRTGPGSRPRRASRAALAVALVSALAGACGDPGETGGHGSGAAPAGFPLTVDNCGVRTVYERPPARAVTLHQHPTEVMLALGLRDRLVGTAFPESDVPAPYAEEYRSIPRLAEKEPSFETVLNAEPDFVYGGYGSAFAKEEGRSRAAFTRAGVATYQNREYCGRKRVSMADVYAEFRAVGDVFGVRERADRLVAGMRRRVDGAHRAVRDARAVPVFVYDSGDGTAYTAGSRGLGTEIVRLAGGRNVFADVDGVFADVSWEQVAVRRPEVIVIHDYTGAGGAERKRDFLLSHPLLKEVPAIRNERFVVVPLTATLIGARPPRTVETLARSLHPGRFD